MTGFTGYYSHSLNHSPQLHPAAQIRIFWPICIRMLPNHTFQICYATCSLKPTHKTTSVTSLADPGVGILETLSLGPHCLPLPVCDCYLADVMWLACVWCPHRQHCC